MPKQQTHINVVRQWCLSLGVLSAVSVTRQEAEMRLAAYVPLLLDRFPDGAFTAASLEHVAAQAVKGFPTYAELSAWLAEWWRAHRPPLPRLAPPDIPPPRPPPTPEEIARVEATVAEVVASLRSSALSRSIAGVNDLPADRPRAYHLAPEQLDRVNPLPNGMKRVGAGADV